MTPTQLKQGSTYDSSVRAFGCPGSKMHWLVTNVVTLCSKDVYKHFRATDLMLDYRARNVIFAKFPDCIEVIHVMFQHGYQHGNSKPEQRIWYLGNMAHQDSKQRWRLGLTRELVMLQTCILGLITILRSSRMPLTNTSNGWLKKTAIKSSKTTIWLTPRKNCTRGSPT